MVRRALITTLAVLTVAATQVVIAAPAQAVTPAAGRGLLALRNGDAAAASNPGRYDVVVLNAWEAGRIPALKSANPAVKVLVYKDMSSTRSYAVRNGVDDQHLPTGVGYAYADAHRPEWFLTDSAGRRIEWVGYPEHWWMDVGNPGYQAAWRDAVLNDLARNGWDGVMVDNAIIERGWYLPSDQDMPRYPSDKDYQAATESFLANVAPALRTAGKLVIPNMGGNTPDMGLYGRWISHTDGALREYWGRWGWNGTGTPFGGWNFDHQLAQMDEVIRQGKLLLAVSYGRTDDVRFMRYARAGFLIGWDGGPSSLLYTPPTAGVDPWAPDWTADIGQPAAPRENVNGAWRRLYSAGMAVVNPSETATATIPLGGTYLRPDGTAVTSVVLGPTEGLILRATEPAAAAPAPAPAPAPEVVSAPAPGQAPAPAPHPSPIDDQGRIAASGATHPSRAARGYWVLGADGGIFSFGDAAFHGSVPGLGLRATPLLLSPTSTGLGYWILGADGGIFSFGDAAFHGSVPGLGISTRAVDLQPTPSGRGYWILGADGGIFSFGDAAFHGSVPGLGISTRVLALAPTPSGRGYWILGADGGIFSFGDAAFRGSVPGVGARTTALSLATTPSGNGYWVLGADGGVFAFGDAAYHGSVPATGQRVPGVALAPTATGRGYYVLGRDGQVFPFGDAPALGSAAAFGIRGLDIGIRL